MPNESRNKPIIPAKLAVKSMRDSGYRDTAHAIAELIDNSVEAGARNVELICVDKVHVGGGRNVTRLDEIAVYDNGSGMDRDTLWMSLQFGAGTHLDEASQKGIGRFGMGLPNSSISQCEKVDVWTWQGGTCYHSYLDVREIISGAMENVPEPKKSSIPKRWLNLTSSKLEKSGTLVVWSRLDRVKWKTSRALLENSSTLIGRIYRYFIAEGEVKIRTATYLSDAGSIEKVRDEFALPTDPLYLMKKTSTPAPFADSPMFEAYEKDDEIDVSFRGKKHRVRIKYSIARKGARELGGEHAVGQHAKRNIGISLVRSRRELEMNQSFTIAYDPRERWWGIEVDFPPGLDDVFGVTNTKQNATAFFYMDLDEDARVENLSPEAFEESLQEQSDPRWVMYTISRRILANLRPMREQIKRMAEVRKKRKLDSDIEVDAAEEAATRATEERKKQGHEGQSDRDETKPSAERAKEIQEEMENVGVDPSQARDIAVEHVQTNTKYIFQKVSFEGAAFFQVASRGGSIIIGINDRHPAAKYLYDLLHESEQQEIVKALEALKLLLMGWARLEDEAQSDKRRGILSDLRTDWGRIARDFLNTANE